MSAETASRPDGSGPSPADGAGGADDVDAAEERLSAATSDARAQDGTHEVVMALLKQQEALLTELRWAYDQLERTQDAEIVQLKSRLARLEEAAGLRSGSAAAPVAAGSSPSSSPATSFAARTRRRVELSLQDPDRAVREAGRRLRRPIGRIARRTGISR